MEQGTFDSGDAEVSPPPPVKLCKCGCGQPAPIAKATNSARGYVKGEPMQFVAGHYGGAKGPLMAKRKLLVEAGQRFGRSVIIDPEVAKPRAGNASVQRAARLRCDCGTYYIRAISRIFRKGDAESCSSCAPPADLTGQRFAKLTVVRWVQSKGLQGRWLCLCDCGNEVTLQPSALTRGHVKSCGCGRFGPRGDAAETALDRVVSRYRHSAEERGLSWELDREDVRRLTSSDCHYCGAAPATAVRKWARYSENHLFNGLDRVDNALGYTLDPCNVVPCCGTCNHAKATMAYSDFMAWIFRLVAYYFFHPELMPSQYLNGQAAR